MNQRKPRSIAATMVGLVTLGAGLAAFLVPLQHAGPYGIPGRGLVGVANQRTFDLRQEKYAIQRLGGVPGMFGDGPGPDTIALRLDPCE